MWQYCECRQVQLVDSHHHQAHESTTNHIWHVTVRFNPHTNFVEICGVWLGCVVVSALGMRTRFIADVYTENV